MKQLTEISAEGMTSAMTASTLREFMIQLDITPEKFENVAKNSPSAEEIFKASQNLGLEMNKVSEVAQEEARVTSVEIEPITFVNQTDQELFSETEVTQDINTESELPAIPTNKNDDNSGNPAEETLEDREKVLATQSQIQQFVIPVIVDRINTYGKPDKETQSVVYKSEEYAASLKLDKDSQTLSLDRNSPESEENQEALLASKDNGSEEYSITVNNLTKDEFERFKALFDEQQTRREQSQQQAQTKQSDPEIG